MRVFTETQQFDQLWVRILMIAVSIITIGSMFMAYPEVAPEDYTTFFLTTIPAVVLVIVLLGLLFIVQLKTKIDEVGIHYGFWPIQRNLRIAKWEEIESCYVREYKPLLEYGGWGYKYSLKGHGKVYNTKGNNGIQIVFKNNSKTLIGTQKKEEAQQVITKYTSKENHYETY